MYRLNQFIAKSGVCSRRSAEKLILSGKIFVNGKLIKDLSTKVSAKDVVKYENKILSIQTFKYILLNKPKGYITSTKDEKNRPTVYELLPAEKKKLIYIGRLDFNSEGLLLFTNNGDFSRLLEIPKSKIIRSYKVKVRGE